VNFAQHILTGLVRLYRWCVSPVLAVAFGPACRFTPTCSAYALEAIQAHGAARGGWLALRRLCRCHPWGGCGCDTVPGKSFQFSVFSFQARPERARGSK
jgi:hypothetical protein